MEITTMNLSQWFQDQLLASAEGFIWGTLQVPKARRLLQPPEGLGEWSAVRHIFHMVFYEQKCALPNMQQWLGEPPPSLKGLDEDVAWSEEKDDVESLLAAFRKVRTDQIALLPKYDESTWNMPYKTIWGRVTLSWAVSKTYQHTAEHTSDVMQIGLFWDDVVKWNKSKKEG
jgi:hypothetical protein